MVKLEEGGGGVGKKKGQRMGKDLTQSKQDPCFQVGEGGRRGEGRGGEERRGTEEREERTDARRIILPETQPNPTQRTSSQHGTVGSSVYTQRQQTHSVLRISSSTRTPSVTRPNELECTTQATGSTKAPVV